MHLLVIILDDLDKLPDLLSAWRTIRVGATLVDSQGGYRVSNWLDRVGLGGLNHLIQGQQVHEQRLLLSVIQDDELLEQAITEAERVLEGFDRPGSGILFVLPVGRTLGLGKRLAPEHVALPMETDVLRNGINLETPVSEIVDILGLRPCVVHRNDPIEKVVEIILKVPSVNVVAVVSEEDRLVGLIDMNSLSEALFYNVFPESFLAELHDLEAVKEFIRRPHTAHTAGDLMQEAEYVYETDNLMTAFLALKKRKLEGIPVLDPSNRPVGYIHMIEMMEIYVRARETGANSEGA